MFSITFRNYKIQCIYWIGTPWQDLVIEEPKVLDERNRPIESINTSVNYFSSFKIQIKQNAGHKPTPHWWCSSPLLIRPPLCNKKVAFKRSGLYWEVPPIKKRNLSFPSSKVICVQKFSRPQQETLPFSSWEVICVNKCPPSTQETLSNPPSQVICVYKCPPP